MTALSGGSLTVRLIRDSTHQPLSSRSFFDSPSRFVPRVSPSAAKTASCGTDLLRKPAVVVSPPLDDGGDVSSSQVAVDWEDQILAETVPLVGLVRMILHSRRYESGDRLAPEHEKVVTEMLLPYHPGYEKKIEGGVDYIMVGYHPDFPDTRCLFIVRKNGESIDFSYWKCIKGLIRKKYPLPAESFISRHFGSRRRYRTP